MPDGRNCLTGPTDKRDFLRYLCEFVEKTNFEQFPTSTIIHTKKVVMDTLGVILAGSQDRPLNQLAEYLIPSINQQQVSTRLGHPERLASLNAALLNGAAGSNREFEEGHSKALGHPAIQMIPAALAQAEAMGQGGKNFLEGVILGYEVAARIGSSAPLRPGFHPSGTWGTVGAATAVAKLSDLNSSEIFDILNIASTLGIAGSVKNSLEGKNISQMYAALSNYFGIFSLLLFRCGFSSSPETFSMTFGKLVSNEIKWERLSKELGKQYLIETNYFKMYPSCRFTHPAIDAFRLAIQNRSIDIEQVDRIDVYTFKWALEMSNPNPENIHAMRFSIPHLLSLYLASGSLTLNTIEEAEQYRSQINTFANRIFVHEDEYFNQKLPQQRGARIVVTLRNGKTLQGIVDDCKGGESDPYSTSQLQSKFIELSTPVIGEKRAYKALSMLENLESLNSISQLTDLLSKRA